MGVVVISVCNAAVVGFANIDADVCDAYFAKGVRFANTVEYGHAAGTVLALRFVNILDDVKFAQYVPEVRFVNTCKDVLIVDNASDLAFVSTTVCVRNVSNVVVAQYVVTVADEPHASSVRDPRFANIKNYVTNASFVTDHQFVLRHFVKSALGDINLTAFDALFS